MGAEAALFELKRALYLTFRGWPLVVVAVGARISEDRKNYLQGAHHPNTTV